MSLRRVDVILAERWSDEDNEKNTNSSSSSDPEKVIKLRLEKWTEGSSTEIADEVETLIEAVQSSMIEAFQEVYRGMQQDPVEELLALLEEMQPLPEDWHDGSRITFHASQVIKVKAF